MDGGENEAKRHESKALTFHVLLFFFFTEKKNMDADGLSGWILNVFADAVNPSAMSGNVIYLQKFLYFCFKLHPGTSRCA